MISMFSDPNVMFAFLLTLGAGMATGLGSAIAFFAHRTNTSLLCIALSFSAGVMIYVSFIEIFIKARVALDSFYGAGQGYLVATIAFFSGMAIVAIIDKLVPHHENPHELHKVEEMDDKAEMQNFRQLHRMGLLTALAIGLHNFPEGIATFMAALRDPLLGSHIAFAIALHNIPEGIAVAVPIFYATASRKKAFGYSFASGMGEPLGALIGYLILRPFLNDAVFGIMFAMIGGIMVFISFDQLLPAARRYGKHHLSVYSLMAGMAVMAASLVLFVKP